MLTTAERLEAARASRLAAEEAGDTTAWVRARALEEVLSGLRTRLDKAANVDRTQPKVRGRGWREPLHPRDREGKFRTVLKSLKVGGVAEVGHGVKVKKVGVGRYEVHGGVGKSRVIGGSKWAARTALERHAVSDNAHRVHSLKVGESTQIGTTTVVRHSTTSYHVYRNDPVKQVASEREQVTVALQNLPKGGSLKHNGWKVKWDGKQYHLSPPHSVTGGQRTAQTEKQAVDIVGTTPPHKGGNMSAHDSALDAVKVARQHEFEKGTVRPTSRKEAAKQKKAEAKAVSKTAALGRTYEEAERVDKFNPPDSRADIHADVVEKGTANPLAHNPVNKIASPAEHGGGEHGGAGHHDPGITAHSAGDHIGAAQHGGLIQGATEHAHELLAKAAPHIGTGKHREALRSANHVVQHMAGAHGDVLHTISHFVQQLFSAHYDDARAARIRAELDGNSTAWVRARTLEEHCASRLDESFLSPIKFDPHRHPRNRTGEFTDVLGKLKQGGRADLPHGTTVRRGTGGYRISGPHVNRTDPRRGTTTAHAAAKFALSADQSKGKPKPPEEIPDMDTAIANIIRSGAAERMRHGDMGWAEFAPVDRGQFVASLHALQPHQQVNQGGYKIEWLPPVVPNPAAIGDINPGAMGSPGIFRMTNRDGQITTRKEPEQVADLVGVKGRSGLSYAVGSVPDPSGKQAKAWDATMADLKRVGQEMDKAGKQGRPKGHADPGVGDPGVGIGAPDPTSPVNIGVTPYRGQAQPPGADIGGYFDTPRFRQFKTRVRKDARDRGLKVTNFSQVAGLWDGNKEPAVSFTVCCDAAKANDMAKDLGQHYNQDGVMTFTSDPGGGAFLYRTTGQVDAARALQAMKDNGVMGGRIQNGKLEVIDTNGAYADAVFKIADELGTDFHYDVGRATLLEKGTDYLAEGHLGEAEGAPEDEADAPHREAEGHDDHADRQATVGAESGTI